MKHHWIAKQIPMSEIEAHEEMKNLKWNGNIPPSYSTHVHENSDNTGGIIALSDVYGGGLAWARYTGKNTLTGKVSTDGFTREETEHLQKRHPKFLEAVNSLT